MTELELLTEIARDIDGIHFCMLLFCGLYFLRLIFKD